jgi:hypothetical protein
MSLLKNERELLVASKAAFKETPGNAKSRASQSPGRRGKKPPPDSKAP